MQGSLQHKHQTDWTAITIHRQETEQTAVNLYSQDTHIQNTKKVMPVTRRRTKFMSRRSQNCLRI